MRIAGDNTTKKANIHPAFALGCRDLFLQVRNRRGGWNGIQGHIHNSGDAPKSSSLGACVEALPFCTAGFIEVNMGIDQPREEDIRGRSVYGVPSGKSVAERMESKTAVIFPVSREMTTVAGVTWPEITAREEANTVI